MTSDRPYRKGLDVDVALEALELNAGKQFCPHTVKAFVGMVDKNLA
jgi:HD-GYP domain-containing protein (c-di-GMP phosphodiesterase class II)